MLILCVSESDEQRTDVGKSVGESPEKAVLRKVSLV